MKRLGEGESYKYLGSPIGLRAGDLLGDLLAKLRKDLDSVRSSELAPWQKIDALHTFLLPRLHFPLRVTATTKKSLARTDTMVYGAVKEWLYLPQRASREIIHLPSHLGGGGYTPLPVLKDCLVVTQAFRMLTCKDPFVRKTAWYSLQEAVHQRLGKIGAPPEKRVLCGYLSGDAEITAGSTAGATASLWSRARRATRDLQRLCGLRWEWSVFRHDISLRLSNPTPHSETLIIPSTSRHRACGLIRRAIGEAYRRRLVAKKDQGKAMEAVTNSWDSSHFLSTGRFTRFCDWRFIHRARLNVLPLNGARRGVLNASRKCRRCRTEDETLPHVLNHCPSHSAAWKRRHDEILSLLRDALPPKWKARLDQKVEGDHSRLRPDLVVTEVPGGTVHIIDVTVPFENRLEALHAARAAKMAKYDDLAARLRCRLQFKQEVHLGALVVGSLGSWDKENERILSRLRIHRGRVATLRKKMVSAAVKWSRDIYCEHVSGQRQYDCDVATTTDID
ncbi:uncharacterized protein T26G10.4-like [Hetaerina americana]|uniref:uncharacterized protein T26G10.4-like n=1 Tax=Hetaerina americana TaxID=62018 RepID=UPI003A7F3531